MTCAACSTSSSPIPAWPASWPRPAARSSPSPRRRRCSRWSPPRCAAQKPGAGVPVLVVTAGERDADQVADLLRCFVPGRRVETFPAWETLPHERLSPRADTVGRRLAVLRDLTHPGENGTIDVLVAPVRSVLQPLAPGPGRPGPGRAEARRRGRPRRRRPRAGRRRLHPRGAGREARRVRRPRWPARRLPAHRAAPGPGGVLGRRGRRAPLLLRRRPALARRAARAAVGAAVPRAAADRRRCARGPPPWPSSTPS